MNITLRERLYRKLVADAESGCLLWAGCCTLAGYGRIKVGARMLYVHRVAWELENGPIPDGLTIDHVKARGCRHKNCANVAHLEPVTPQVNVLRGNSFSAVNAVKTHCDLGHPFDEANTYWRPDGDRGCRTCKYEAVIRFRQRQAAQRDQVKAAQSAHARDVRNQRGRRPGAVARAIETPGMFRVNPPPS